MFMIILKYHVPLSARWYLLGAERGGEKDTASTLGQSEAEAPNWTSNPCYSSPLHAHRKRKNGFCVRVSILSGKND